MKDLDFRKQLIINEFKTMSKGKSKEEIAQFTKDYLPDLSAETTAKLLSDNYLHGSSDDRCVAIDGREYTRPFKTNKKDVLFRIP